MNVFYSETRYDPSAYKITQNINEYEYRENELPNFVRTAVENYTETTWSDFGMKTYKDQKEYSCYSENSKGLRIAQFYSPETDVFTTLTFDKTGFLLKEETYYPEGGFSILKFVKDEPGKSKLIIGGSMLIEPNFDEKL